MELNYKLIFFTTVSLVGGVILGTKVGYNVGREVGYKEGVSKPMPLGKEQPVINGHI